MKAYTITRDHMQEYLSGAGGIQRIAAMSKTVQEAQASADQYLASLRQAIQQLETTDWQAEIAEEEKRQQDWLDLPYFCASCGSHPPRRHLFWTEQGKRAYQYLLCETCARSEEDSYFNEPFYCEACNHVFKRHELRSVDISNEHPFAKSGWFVCETCLPQQLVYFMRVCSHCGSEFHSEGYSFRDTPTCPACRVIDAERETRVVRASNSRAHNAGAIATLTVAEWLESLQVFRGYCAYCQRGAYEVLEHFIPLSQGGGTTAQNCVPSCNACNLSKTNLHPLQVSWPTSTRVTPGAIERVQAYLATRAN